MLSSAPRLRELFDYCKSEKCALPAVNVIGSHSANAVLEAAREAKSPVIVQFSHSGAQFYAGKMLDNKAHLASIAGAIAGAHHVRTLAEAYGVPVILHTDHCAKKLLPWVDGMLDAGEALLRGEQGAAVQLAHARPVRGAARTRTSRSAAST